MARKKRKKRFRSFFGTFSEGLQDETKHGVLSVIFFVIALFLVFIALGIAGSAGDRLYLFFSKILGSGFLFLPLAFLLLSMAFFKNGRAHIISTNIIGGLLFFFSSLGFIGTFSETHGGTIGRFVAYPFTAYFSAAVGALFFAALFIISFLILFDTKLPRFRLGRNKEKAGKENRIEISDKTSLDEGKEAPEEEKASEHEEDEEYAEEEEKDTPRSATSIPFLGGGGGKTTPPPYSYGRFGAYTPPPLSLLEGDRGKPSHGDIKANGNIIKRTLLNFNIEVELDEISVGPSFTRYAIKPAEGVRLSRIVALQSNLELALAAHPLRIEAPIPGKSLVGIEIPNMKKSVVSLASLLSSKIFSEEHPPLLAALGRGVTGEPVFANIAKAPHFLIAGATGSGKSVSIHSIITSLIYSNSPERLLFIMIDPKRVELTLYKGIPHLPTPVITSAKEAILALKWAIREMERRYDILETEQVRDIGTYHETILKPAIAKKDDSEELPEPMPYILIIIDELADIMSAYPKELESAIVRLAQMSRAVGIHLILSTQRPSVNVITGLIKANVPARIALQVASQIDSRTIIDMAGAEKLLGSGDMLYMSGEMSKPVRLQSAFIGEKEVKKVSKFLKDHSGGLPQEHLDLKGEEAKNNVLTVDLTDNTSDDLDELYEDARELVISTGQASSSYFMRKFGIGYARSARILDSLEERGVVGPGHGSKAREVLVKPTDNGGETNEGGAPNT